MDIFDRRALAHDQDLANRRIEPDPPAPAAPASPESRTTATHAETDAWYARRPDAGRTL